MGIVGRDIDALNDEQRDRVIEANAWIDPESGSWVCWSDPSCRCLMGHAHDWYRNEQGWQLPREGNGDRYAAAYRFPTLCERFGMDRIVRLCKARAAKANRIPALRAEVYEGIQARIEALPETSKEFREALRRRDRIEPYDGVVRARGELARAFKAAR